MRRCSVDVIGTTQTEKKIVLKMRLQKLYLGVTPFALFLIYEFLEEFKNITIIYG